MRKDILAQEAAEWLVALDEPDGKTRADFADWLRASPEHVREFLAAKAIWDALPDVLPRPPLNAVVDRTSGQSNVVALPVADRRPVLMARRRDAAGGRWPARAAALALLGLGLGALIVFAPPRAPVIHATAIGEQAAVPLADGSVVTLNTLSSMRVSYSGQYRDVRLFSGEALFDVAEDRTRPFRVITDQAVIQAVGTRFNVRADAEDVTVSVLEGLVDIAYVAAARESAAIPGGGATVSASNAPVRLKVGQQLQVRSGAGKSEVVDIAVEKVSAWQQRRLVFEALPLEQVIEEFNRYNDPPAVIAEERLKGLLISGVFRSDDRDSFVQFLSQMELADSARREDGVILINPKKSGRPDPDGQAPVPDFG